jgi:hypothetical protein
MTDDDLGAQYACAGDGIDYLSCPEQFLVVANFLSKFHPHLLPYGDDVEARNIGNISPKDLEDVLKYRSILDDMEYAEDDRFVVEEFGRNSPSLQPVSSRLIPIKQEKIDRLKGETDAVADRIKKIHLLLERLEVWSTKYLSQDFLLSSTKILSEESNAETDHCCFSPLLNLPASAYFASRMPVVSTHRDQARTPLPTTDDDRSKLSAFHRPNKEISCCSLAIPPNRHTWRAYARISSMVSLLEHPKHLEQAVRSPFCDYDVFKQKKGQRLALYARQHIFAPSSLLALWVRAQRNTRALRHLWMLFEVQRVNNNQGGTNLASSYESESAIRAGTRNTSVPVQSPECRRQLTLAEAETLDDARGITGQNERNFDVNTVRTKGAIHRELRFRAIFRGNPLYAKYRVVDTGRRVDQLVEWAVVNQSLYTYSRIKRDLLTEPQRRERHKRKRLRELYSDSQTKRRRSEGDIDTALKELYKACQSFILRWFARRNRKTLSILFTNHTESLELDIGCSADSTVCSKVRELESADVLGVFHKVFAQRFTGVTHAEGRNFALIDRDLAAMGKYDASSTVTFRSHMLGLLDAFFAACPEKNVDPTVLASIRQDFIALHDQFLPPGEVDILKTASSLVTLNPGISVDLLDIIKATPTPWPQACFACRIDHPKLKTCRNCERVFHEGCSPGCTGVNFKQILESFPPSLDLLKLKKPTNSQRPDLLNVGSVQWKSEEIIFERKLGQNGRVEPIGVWLQPLDECRNAFDMLDSDSSSLFDLISMEEENTGNNNPVVPVAIENLGCLVTSVQKGMIGARFGLKDGDIVTRLELLEFIDAGDKKVCESQVFEMNKIALEERIAVLKAQSSRLKITFLRPSVNIIDVASAWYKDIRKLNMKMLEAFRLHSKLWYCGSCVGQAEVEPGESNQIFREAHCCRAVIRRLGMESYSLPFLDEEQRDDGTRFSLRRLDSMMTHIMHTHSKDKKFEQAAEAFLATPSTDTGRERVPWAAMKALEKRPMELLCNAMKFAMNSPFPGVPDLNSQRSSFLVHFLVAFASWCVGTTAKSDGFKGTKGPPPILKHLRPPWLKASCSVCFSRAVFGDEVTCTSDFCRNNVRDMHIEDVGDEEILRAGDCTDDYVRLASMVGTTFLVLPTDPLVKSVSKHVHIDHQERPVEFIVASYLPASFNEEVTRCRPKDSIDKYSECDGIFHLLPVVNADQQLFLLERAKVRDLSEKNSSGKAWAFLDLLNLEGVARFSPAALLKKIEESTAIRIAMEQMITQQLRLKCLTPHSSMDSIDSNNLEDAAKAFPTCGSNRNLCLQTNLLDSLLKGKASTELIRSLVSAESDAEINQINEVAADTFKMDIFATDPGDTSGHMFGSSSLQPGLLIVLNPVETSKKILPLHADSGCLIYYSDLQYEFEAARLDLQKTLFPQDLHQLQPVSADEAVLSIVLSPSNESNIGWGFELVRWEKEAGLRIGRVQKHSTAFEAGLKPHDKIESVNGMKLGKFGSQCEFILAVLGVRNTNVRTSRMLGIEEISQVISTIKTANLEISTVYLVISRPRLAEAEFDQLLDKAPYAQQQGFKPVHLTTHRERSVYSSTAPSSLDGNRIEVQEASSPVPMAPLERNRDSVQPCGMVQPTTAPRAPSREQEINTRGETNIAKFIRETYHLRHPVCESDFYRPALQGTILTRLEVAVFLNCVMAGNQWKLGVRLLMPRYELKTALAQVKTILCWTHEQFTPIPLISERMYERILRSDYERMTCPIYPETGEFVLVEVYNGQLYKYRLPRRPLPIDRLIERHDQEHLESLVQQNRYHQPPPPRRQGLNPDRSQIKHSEPRQQRYDGDEIWRDESSDHVTRCRHQFGMENDATEEIVNLVDDVQERLFFNFDDSLLPHREAPVQGSRRVGNVNDKSIILNPFHCTGESTERIRGGGDSAAGGVEEQGYNEVCLLDIPLGEWNGRAVCYDCTAETNGTKKEAYLIGFVRVPKDWDSRLELFPKEGDIESHIPDKVDVEVHYVSTIGYLERTMEFNLDTEGVYAVDVKSASAEARVVATLLSEKKSLPETSLTDARETQEDTSQKEEPPTAGVPLNQEIEECTEQEVSLGAVETRRQEDGIDRIKEIAVEFSRRLTDLELLGTLPDGSDVFWISNDPTNIFIDESPREQMLERSQREYLQCLQRAQEFGPEVISLRVNESNKFYCAWGCSVVNSTSKERNALAFESVKDLNLHHSKVHTITTRTKEVMLGQRRSPLLPQEGHAIVDLARGITSAICARFPLLLEEVHMCESSLGRMDGIPFFKSPTSSIINFPVNLHSMKVASELIKSSKSQAVGIRSLFHLWSRLARLYHCDTTGRLRVSHNEFRPFSVDLLTRAQTLSNECFGTSGGKTSTSSENPMCTGVHSCRLCSLPFEKYLRYADMETKSDCLGKVAYSCRSIGCSLLSDAVLRKEAPSSAGRRIPGRLGSAKLLLLKVAHLIPDSVKSKISLGSTRSSESDLVDALYSRRVFDGDNFATWKAFVIEVKTTRMLAQAFVTLLASINRTKLPSWWRLANGGWSTAFMVMSESCLSTLYLHIYVFDAAMSELIAGSLHTPTAEQILRSNAGLERKYDTYWARAKSLGFEPFEGDSKNWCYHCEEGGTLICCDLCPNVQHHECNDPPLSPGVNLDHWICDSCLHDIDNFDGYCEQPCT